MTFLHIFLESLLSASATGGSLFVVIALLTLLAAVLGAALWRLNAENRRLEAERTRLQTELRLTIERQREQTNERKNDFERELALVREQMQAATEQMLEKRARQLGVENAGQLDALLAPLRTTIGQMQQTMDRTRQDGTRNATAIAEGIRHVMQTADDVGRRADNLADAIRGNVKMQGNMGEFVLEELLRSQGLTEGRHFTTQATLVDAKGHALKNDESGSRMIPDVLVHFPDGRDVVIDSKVSLNAFVDFHNATDDDARRQALRRHLQSLRNHVDELARKNYAKYHFKDHAMLPFVIMFVPYEAALQTALGEEPALWREAFDRGVYMAGGQTLLAALSIVKLTWQQQQQFEGQQHIVRLAEEIVERTGLFYERYQTIGEQIDRLQRTYDDTAKTLKTGNRSLLVPARSMLQLGVKNSKAHPLPRETDGEPQE